MKTKSNMTVKDKEKKIKRLELRNKIFGYPYNGSNIEFETLDDTLRDFDSHHSCIREDVLVKMLEKIQKKMNLIIKRLNNYETK